MSTLERLKFLQEYGMKYEDPEVSTIDPYKNESIEEHMKRVITKAKEARKNIMMKKTGSKTTKHVELPTYKVEEKDPTYKLRRGKVMEAHSNLHANKDGKRTITTKVKIWHGLNSKEKESLKQSILIALS